MRYLNLVIIGLGSLFFQMACSGDSATEPLCDPGTQGCDCLEDGSCTTAGMICVEDLCVSELQPPTNPQCYSPCRQGLLSADGEYRPCSAEGLMDGCIGDNVCVNGSCAPTGSTSGSLVASLSQAQSEACHNDSQCPDFQTCIDGSCYSTCETDDECQDGTRCHRHVCRQPCNNTDLPCESSDRVCVPQDGVNGFCMPAEASAEEAQAVPEGNFSLSKGRIEFSNTQPSGSFILDNQHPAPQDFVISKYRHTGYGEDGTVSVHRDDGQPLFWLQMGEAGALSKEPEITVHLAPFSSVEILLNEAGSVVDEDLQYRWDGVLRIENHQMGHQELLLTFVSRPEGQWSGNMYTFASFRDEGISAWQDSGSTAGLENAFLVFWDEFKNGQRTSDQFIAMLNSTLDETWKYPWVEEYGNCSLQENACFPDDSAEGYGIYTQDLKDKPIPTGAVAFPMAMNLKQEDTPAMLRGKIVTDKTLHYAGDPAVQLEFDIDPSQCQANLKGVVICPVKTFATQVLVGGRYVISDPENDDCANYAEASYEVQQIPWLVPGFLTGTSKQDGAWYRSECRDRMLPFGDPGDDAALAALNQSYAASNPIPDGHTRLRTVSLIDGALVNGKDLFLIYREHFASFMGEDDLEGFSAYGIMHLTRSTALLEESDYQGSEVVEDRIFDSKLPAVTCTQALLDEIEEATGTAYDPDNAADVDELANTLLEGGPDAASTPEITAASEEKVHWYCEDTGLIDGRVKVGSSDYQVPCPEDSRVTYFTLTRENPAADTQAMLDGLDCDNDFEAGSIKTGVKIGEEDDKYDYAKDSYHNTVEVEILSAGHCGQTIDDWKADTEAYENGGPMPDHVIRMDPVWRCDHSDQVYCSDDRLDLRKDKVFYEEADTGGMVFLNAPAAVHDAFRYKTRFRSRTGKTLGFTPSICAQSSAAIPYCYDPEGIENIAGRVDCLVYLYTEHDSDMSADIRGEVRDFLRTTFAYLVVSEDADGNQLELPVVHEGFERLLAELLIMMGDEAYTSAFASRFDLAGSAIRSFEGSLFEPPDGINLSGGAGFEMVTLYQATQYYQMTLDRFSKLSPLIWQTLSTGTSETSFVTQATVTAYFDRLIRASTQKSRAWSEIAKRYQQFNRPDIARRVVARAYSSTYLESVVLSRMMLKMKRVVELADWPQISQRVELAQLGYRSALRKMRDVYDSISDRETYFGYAPDYVPFPAMDPFDINAFEKAMALAKEKLSVAATKEVTALSTERSFDTDAEAFQSELVSIRNNYENQLGDLCGTFEGDDGRIYAATPKYAPMHDKLRHFPADPCGLVGNGKIHEAMAEVDIAALALKRAGMDIDDKIDEMKIERHRVETMCDLIEDTAQYVFDKQGEILTHQQKIRSAQIARDATERVMQHAENIATLANCSPLTGQCAISGLNIGVLTVGYALWEGLFIGLDAHIAAQETDIAKLEKSTSKWQLERECDYARVDSDAKVRTLMLDIGSLHVELLKAMHRLKLASSKVVRLVNEAQRVRDEQSETEQLAINVAAARNDPNFRIYKNDAILTADRTFDTALGAAYRATKVYEYYTSQSYAPLLDLFLVRMVAHGDITLEAYLGELESNFIAFEEQYGNPDLRVAVLSLRDQILNIGRYDENSLPLTEEQRTQMMRDRLGDVALLDARGYIVIPFASRLDELSPLTRNHKVSYIEAQILGADLGDAVARLYLSPRGTGTVLGVDGQKTFFRFPHRTAVLNAIVGEQRAFSGNVVEGDVYKNKRLRDMPMVNSNWELTINQRDEKANQDINLQSLDDILLYVYYTDFTQLD